LLLNRRPLKYKGRKFAVISWQLIKIDKTSNLMYYTIPFFKKSFKISDIFHTVIILVINECGTVLQYILTICRPLKSHGDADREHIDIVRINSLSCSHVFIYGVWNYI
jgi:hypothetical protein